jgi:hypothetical protein
MALDGEQKQRTIHEIHEISRTKLSAASCNLVDRICLLIRLLGFDGRLFGTSSHEEPGRV